MEVARQDFRVQLDEEVVIVSRVQEHHLKEKSLAINSQWFVRNLL